MSSKRIAMLVENAHRADDVNAARDAMNQYYSCHCLHPIKQRIYDSHIGGERIILIGCGRCVHCMESKINEWCTRMYAHAEDFKHVYFVTLTYRSITNPDVPANKLLLNKLSQAVWNRDAFNSTHHYSYNPCLLVKSHYQNFLKRLRKNTGLKDITFVLSGELGSEYGRPHFHLILFTNGILTKQDVVRAWSVCLWQTNQGKWTYRTSQRRDGTAYDFPIGRVDFHDLVTNGSFNTTAKIKVDGRFMNVANCFSYVAKYVVKRDKPNLNRVRLAYRNLFHTETLVKLFDNEVSYILAKQWLLDHGYSKIAAEELYNNSLKQLSYDKIIYEPSKTIYSDGIQRFTQINYHGYKANKCLLPETYFEFKREYLPFCEFSRGCPIGSVYAKKNLQEFTQGIFTKPLLQDSGFVVPSYFRIKAQKYLYRFREVHRTCCGDSFALGCLPDLQRRIDVYNQNGSLPFPTATIDQYHPHWDKTIYHTPTLYADSHTGERITFSQDSANYWRYSRKDRKYHVTKTIPIAEFIRVLAFSLGEEFERAKQKVALGKENMRLRERALLMMCDLGDEESTLTVRFSTCQKAWLEERSKLYRESHVSAE